MAKDWLFGPTTDQNDVAPVKRADREFVAELRTAGGNVRHIHVGFDPTTDPHVCIIRVAIEPEPGKGLPPDEPKIHPVEIFLGLRGALVGMEKELKARGWI